MLTYVNLVVPRDQKWKPDRISRTIANALALMQSASRQNENRFNLFYDGVQLKMTTSITTWLKPYMRYWNGAEQYSCFLQVVKNTKHRTVIKPHRQSKPNFMKGEISLSRTVKLQTLANACQSQAREKTPCVKNFQDWYQLYDKFSVDEPIEKTSKYDHQLMISKSYTLKFELVPPNASPSGYMYPLTKMCVGMLVKTWSVWLNKHSEKKLLNSIVRDVTSAILNGIIRWGCGETLLKYCLLSHRCDTYQVKCT